MGLRVLCVVLLYVSLGSVLVPTVAASRPKLIQPGRPLWTYILLDLVFIIIIYYYSECSV